MIEQGNDFLTVIDDPDFAGAKHLVATEMDGDISFTFFIENMLHLYLWKSRHGDINSIFSGLNLRLEFDFTFSFINRHAAANCQRLPNPPDRR